MAVSDRLLFSGGFGGGYVGAALSYGPPPHAYGHSVSQPALGGTDAQLGRPSGAARAACVGGCVDAPPARQSSLPAAPSPPAQARGALQLQSQSQQQQPAHVFSGMGGFGLYDPAMSGGGAAPAAAFAARGALAALGDATLRVPAVGPAVGSLGTPAVGSLGEDCDFTALARELAELLSRP